MRLHRKRGALALEMLAGTVRASLCTPRQQTSRGARKQQSGKVHLAGHFLMSRDGFKSACKLLKINA